MRSLPPMKVETSWNEHGAQAYRQETESLTPPVLPELIPGLNNHTMFA
jgi:hypothetical protein